MQAMAVCSQGRATFQFDGTESDLWRKAANLLIWVKTPDVFTVFAGNGKAELEVGDSIKLLSNTIQAKESRYEKRYLARVNPETNQYDFYKIVPNNMGPRTISVGGSFGRIGSKKGDLTAETVIRSPYAPWLYWVKYYEKLRQGYQDVGEGMFADDDLFQPFEPTENEIPDGEEAAVSLYRKLRNYAKEALSSQVNVNFLSEKPPFTRRQAENGWKIWKTLGSSKNVKEFNKKLEKLMAISPRRVDNYRGQTLKSLMAAEAPTPEEQEKIYAEIIAREESLLMAMDAVTNVTGKKPEDTMFGDVRISVASEEEKEQVMAKLEPELQKRVRCVYLVRPKGQEERFEAYLKDCGIRETRYFWHGSRNENWISIIRNSLSLNPNAVITGKMWGNGIYFAPSSMKSWGYTQIGKWVGGSADSVFMGLYETAYGNPYFPDSRVDGTKELLKEHRADCLHAHAGSAGLRMDEVVFFDEDAMCIRYLVEFAV